MSIKKGDSCCRDRENVLERQAMFSLNQLELGEARNVGKASNHYIAIVGLHPQRSIQAM
jgi:hypothetical protein